MREKQDPPPALEFLAAKEHTLALNWRVLGVCERQIGDARTIQEWLSRGGSDYDE